MPIAAVILALMLQGPANTPTQGPVAGSVACQACHSPEFEKWSDSIHGKMIQRANRNTVVSKVNQSGGPATAKLWKNDVLYILENGRENRIDYTLGNRRMQHYLTTMPNGEIHVLHSTWDVKRQQWFDSKEIVPGAPAQFVQQWNMSCFYCHTTQQEQDVKGFDPDTFEYKTSWVESSATCERCHGPMASHVQAAERGEWSEYPQAELTTSFDKLVRCGQCHWAKTVVSTGFDMRKPYFDYYAPALMHLEENDTIDPGWWVDGRPRRFSNEAAAFFMSGCFQSGKATCTSCHDPHWNRTDGNDALMKNADQYCISCHSGLKSTTHTNHAVESAGSSCVGCHMPHAMQGVKATMRDHSMSIPEPENTVRYNVPNACNECHTGQSAEWALNYVEKWYPGRSARPRMRATAFSLARKEDVRAVNILIRLATDRAENAEMRATATGYLGRFQTDSARATVIALAKDPEPLVRVEVARSLGLAGTEPAATALAGMLDDRYRSVRVEAASSLTSPIFPRMTFASETQKSFDKAVAEFRRSLEIEGDHPHVQVRLGGLEFLLGNLPQAREAYRRALKRNPAEADAYVGLAMLDFQAGDRAEALRNARRAVEVSGKDQYRKFLERIEGQR